MENNNNNNKKYSYIGVTENQYITINKTYKSIINNKGKMHSMFMNDSFQDQTGTWITTGSYQLRWFGEMDIVVGDKIKVIKIKHIEQNSYLSKTGVKQYIINTTIEVEKQQNQYSQYGNYQQYSSYGNYHQQQQQVENNYDDDNYYGSYGGGNNDFGI